MNVRVIVTLKPGVLDPAGKAIHHALGSLGFADVQEVRTGRLFDLDVPDGTSREQVDEMARQLLANMVIERFTIEGI